MASQPLLIQKYGGSSVATTDRIRAVAKRVAAARRAGNQLVVVVSAMGDTTDDLLALARDLTGGMRAALDHPREMDMLLTAGERISMALLAMAIRGEGVGAVSMTGSQAAIITDEAHTAARITEVRADRVREALQGGEVVIVAGFQGVSRTKQVTTLGRGGSDTTAVALAAALQADRCEIYTDVPGVYTADPRKVETARIIRQISYPEMLELAAGGAQVMHPRAIEIASRYNVDVRVASSFEEGPEIGGTLITRKPRPMEELVLTGIASQPEQAKLTLRGYPAGMHSVTAVLVALAEGGVSVDMITEAQEPGGGAQLQVTVAEAQVEEGERIIVEVLRRLGGGEVSASPGLSRLALVGRGMHQRSGVYARAFRTLLDRQIDVSAVSTSGISINLWIPGKREAEAIAALHDAFTLELAGQGATGDAI